MGLNGKKTIIGIIGLAVFGGLAQAFPDQGWLAYVAKSFGGLAAVGAAHKVKKWKDGKALFGLLLALSLGMGGCATLNGNGLGGGILDALEAAGKGALEDANVKKHLFDFLHDAGDLLFGDDAPVEVPTDAPSEPNGGGSGETSVVSEG